MSVCGRDGKKQELNPHLPSGEVNRDSQKKRKKKRKEKETGSTQPCYFQIWKETFKSAKTFKSASLWGRGTRSKAGWGLVFFLTNLTELVSLK